MATDPFGPSRKRLLGLAYRMLGDRTEAEDVLQDAWLRFHAARDADNRDALLTTIVTRLCLDRLKSARARREDYVGPWLPEPVADTSALSPDAATELADDLSFALLLALERLSPAQRAAFLLHDVFDMSFAEVATVLDRQEPACRQLAARARKAVQRKRPAPGASQDAHRRLLAAFGTAVASGDLTALTSLLHEDAVLIADGGGKVTTALNPIRGADRIVRFFVGIVRKFGKLPADFSAELTAINGLPGIVTRIGERVDQVLTIDTAGASITAVYVVRNPEKLRAITGDIRRRPHSANRIANSTNKYGLVSALALYAVSTLGMAHESTARPVSEVSAADHLEPGLQGETIAGEAKDLPRPYAKGVRLLGKVAVPAGVGGTMAWSGHCAYIPGPSGVSVIDVHNPRAPSVVRVLADKGAVGARETVDASGGILAASVYGQHGPGSRPGFDNPAKAWLAIYDVADCANPRLLAEYKWPERVHTITISSNGKRIYGTVIYPGTGHGGIQVLDIENPARPRFLGKFGVTRADGSTFEFSPHAITLSPDETRIYAGVISSAGDDLNRNLSSSAFPSVETFGPDAGGIYVLDNSEIAAGRTDPKIRLIGTARHAGWHSAVPARINGVPYLVGAGEMGACPGSWPRITSIADETKPVAVGEFRLQMNLKGNCPPRDEAETRSNGIVGRDGTAASHWNDVDNPTDTRLGLFPFTWAGLRIVDLREPASPIEVAYFKPGDNCMTHARYVREAGHIWFGCTGSGFYVIELQPELRASLGLPKPEGR